MNNKPTDTGEYRPLVVWESGSAIGHRDCPERTYSVVRYGRWLRKQACLVEHSKTSATPIAWFPDEAAAVRFAEEVLGGVRFSGERPS